MVRVADSSALYAALVREDAHHADAREALAEPEPIVVPTEILVETINLLDLRVGRRAGREALASLMSLPHLSLADKVQFEAVRRIYDGNPGLSLADAFVVQTCRAMGAPPLSYDDDIVAAAGEPA